MYSVSVEISMQSTIPLCTAGDSVLPGPLAAPAGPLHPRGGRPLYWQLCLIIHLVRFQTPSRPQHTNIILGSQLMLIND